MTIEESLEMHQKAAEGLCEGTAMDSIRFHCRLLETRIDERRRIKEAFFESNDPIIVSFETAQVIIEAALSLVNEAATIEEEGKEIEQDWENRWHTLWDEAEKFIKTLAIEEFFDSPPFQSLIEEVRSSLSQSIIDAED